MHLPKLCHLLHRICTCIKLTLLCKAIKMQWPEAQGGFELLTNRRSMLSGQLAYYLSSVLELSTFLTRGTRITPAREAAVMKE